MKRILVLFFSGLLSSSAAFSQVAGAPDLIAAMSEPAGRLLASVAGGPGGIERLAGYDRQTSLSHPLDDPQRQNWQYWPAVRIGLSLELMTAEQRLWSHDMFTALLSSSGYLKATSIMQLEQILLDEDLAGFPRGVGHYKVVIFGDPADAQWAWRLEGHHISLSVSIAGDEITVTPSFFGANPAEVRAGPLAGLRIHGRLENLARQLVESLEGPQRAAALVSGQAPAEIYSSLVNLPADQWNEWRTTLQPAGVVVDDLNEMQQHWVGLVLAEVVNNYTDEISGQFRDQIDVESLRFAWMGPIAEGEPHYFRLQGPDFVFEYDNVQRDGNHVHSVWRSKAYDFGRNVLADHYLSATH